VARWSNYRFLTVLLIGILALSSCFCSQIDEFAPAPVTAYEHRGAQMDAMSPAPTASTATSSNEQTRVAGKITGTSKPLAVSRTAGNYPPGDKGRLISSTPSPRFLSACLQFVCGRSPPSGSSTQL